MSDERASGIVLRTRPLTETSLVVHWLTADQGRLATVAKGARRPKSPFRGKLDLFYEAEFSFVRSRRSDLHALREVMVCDTHVPLRKDLERLQQSAYAVALIEQTTEPETPLPAVFRLLAGLLARLSESATRPQTIFAFELKLLIELGQAPVIQSASVSPGSRELLRKLMSSNWEMIGRLKPTVAQTRELDRFLRAFLIYHCGKVPPGRVSLPD